MLSKQQFDDQADNLANKLAITLIFIDFIVIMLWSDELVYPA